jgi:hypothetical protein
VEQLFNLPPLVAQKPSELLAEMLRLCPRGQENNAFFNCLNLNKLPRELRILLSEADCGYLYIIIHTENSYMYLS